MDSEQSHVLVQFKMCFNELYPLGGHSGPLRVSLEFSSIFFEFIESGVTVEAEHTKLDKTLPRCPKGCP